jgi:hypothetical protein
MQYIDYTNIESIAYYFRYKSSVKMEISKKLNNLNQFIVEIIINIMKTKIK